MRNHGVDAALELIKSIDDMAPASEKLRVRIGMATGVVIGRGPCASDVADKPPIVGNTPNLAARLQAIAEPIPL